MKDLRLHWTLRPDGTVHAAIPKHKWSVDFTPAVQLADHFRVSAGAWFRVWSAWPYEHRRWGVLRARPHDDGGVTLYMDLEGDLGFITALSAGVWRALLRIEGEVVLPIPVSPALRELILYRRVSVLTDESSLVAIAPSAFEPPSHPSRR